MTRGLLIAAAGLLLAGCMDEAPCGCVITPEAATSASSPALRFSVMDEPDAATNASGPFTLAAAAYAPGALAAANGFPMRVVVALPTGGYVRAYGMRTRYEEVESPVKGVVPLPGGGGTIDVPCGPLSVFSAGGAVAMKDVEFWLVNDRGETSNAITARSIDR